MLGSIQRTHTMAHLSEEERGCHSVGSERNKDCKGGGEGGDLRGRRRRLRCRGLLFPLHLIISQEKGRKREWKGTTGTTSTAGNPSLCSPSLPPSFGPSFSPSSRLFSFCSPSRSLFRSIDRRMPSFSCFLFLRQLFTRTELPKYIQE